VEVLNEIMGIPKEETIFVSPFCWACPRIYKNSPHNFLIAGVDWRSWPMIYGEHCNFGFERVSLHPYVLLPAPHNF